MEKESKSHGQQVRQTVELIYGRQTHERTVFMNELAAYRKRRDKKLFKTLKDAVGPRWYQALSVNQRQGLDFLEHAIYQDILSGRPSKSAQVMHALGIYPPPNRSLLMQCVYAGRNNPMELLAHLYYETYGYPIEGKRLSYSLNARLMLSAILYLGMPNVIELLRERFAPPIPSEQEPPKPKPRQPKIKQSPYLQTLVAHLYEPPVYKRPPPPPLPNLNELNEPYEEEPIMPKPPPPPPPPPPPKKRIPREVCDSLADVRPVVPNRPSDLNVPKKALKDLAKKKRSKIQPIEGKKVYGIGIDFSSNKGKKKKMVIPKTGLENYQYTINGVAIVRGRAVLNLASVCILPVDGDFIHGGFAMVNGKFVTIHCGYRAQPPPPPSPPCDCLKHFHDNIFTYLRNSKCYCGHLYDFREEINFDIGPTNDSVSISAKYLANLSPLTGANISNAPHTYKPAKTIIDSITDNINFPRSNLGNIIASSPGKMSSNVPKEGGGTVSVNNQAIVPNSSPVGNSPPNRPANVPNSSSGNNPAKNPAKSPGNYPTSFPADELPLFIKATRHSPIQLNYHTIYNLNEKDLHVEKDFKKTWETDSLLHVEDPEAIAAELKNAKKKKKKVSSQTCLDEGNAKPVDYLRCAIRFMRRQNTAARLPDLHLVPELIEWMRNRLYGPITQQQKNELLFQSNRRWQYFHTLALKGFGHVSPKTDPDFGGRSNWLRKKYLTDKFKKYTLVYRLQMYRSFAYVNNLFWRTMYQAEQPDKQFRAIYFSYLFAKFDDLQLCEPYNVTKANFRKNQFMNKRVVCLPKGVEDVPG